MQSEKNTILSLNALSTELAAYTGLILFFTAVIIASMYKGIDYNRDISIAFSVVASVIIAAAALALFTTLKEYRSLKRTKSKKKGVDAIKNYQDQILILRNSGEQETIFWKDVTKVSLKNSKDWYSNTKNNAEQKLYHYWVIATQQKESRFLTDANGNDDFVKDICNKCEITEQPINTFLGKNEEGEYTLIGENFQNTHQADNAVKH